MNSLFHRSLLVSTALSAALIGTAALADNGIADVANILIYGNSDSSAGSEGVWITSNSGLSGSVPANQATLSLNTQGNATLGANNVLTLNGGSTSLNSGSNTTISSSGTNTITGAANNIVGATSINTGSNAGAVTIGNAANTTTINSSATSINSTTATINGATANLNSVTNNIGAGAFASTVNIGSTQSGTTVNTTAGNSSTTVANNAIRSTVLGAGGVSGGLSVVNSGQSGAVVDANGKITTGTTTQTTAALTVTNALGNAHGLVVQQNQTVLTGGATSTSFTLNDNGATFGNSATGAPVKVTGVADGVNSYDAVNVRQLRSAYAGVAGAAAMANIPAIDPGKKFALGAGLGGFKGQSAIAIGAAARIGDNAQLRASLSSGLNDNSGSRNTAFAVGAGFSF